MRKLVALLSSDTVYQPQEKAKNQQRALELLDEAGISPEKVYGDDPTHEERRRRLYRESLCPPAPGRHDYYPQFFLVDKLTGETEFLGDFDRSQELADENQQTKEALGNANDDVDDEPEGSLFTGMPIEKFQPEPIFLALADWDTTEKKSSNPNKDETLGTSREDRRNKHIEAGSRIGKGRASKVRILAWLLIIFGGVGVFLLCFKLKKDGQTTDKTADGGDDADATLGEGDTTVLDPFNVDSCDFAGKVQPHVIDQCACSGKISVISDSIRGRYEIHKQDFVPTVYQDYSEAIDSCSIRNQALVWLSSGNDFQFNADERKQRFALAVLFIGLNGREWTNTNGWLSTSISCDWFGVVCGGDDSVTAVDLHSNNLSGSIESEIILLQTLNTLNLSNNRVTGEPPAELFFLRDLAQLDLSFNQLTGSTPLSIHQALALTVLNLEMNEFVGSFPDLSRSTNLAALNLGSNTFQGSFPIWMFDLPNLSEIHLHRNLLFGTIPSEIAKATALTTLNLSVNTLFDAIPSEISDLLLLNTLDLSENLLTGTVPAEFEKLTLLSELRLNENLLFGSLPTQLGNLSSLEILLVDGNRISGSVPDEICRLRDDSLKEVVVDCPITTAVGRSGVECSIPGCCTNCAI